MKNQVRRTDQQIMRELRLFREFSYRDVAKRIGMSHSRIQQLENGTERLADDFKRNFLAALNLTDKDWELLQIQNESILDMKLECLSKIHSLDTESLSRCLLLIRNLGLALLVLSSS